MIAFSNDTRGGYEGYQGTQSYPIRVTCYGQCHYEEYVIQEELPDNYRGKVPKVARPKHPGHHSWVAMSKTKYPYSGGGKGQRKHHGK